MTRAHFTTVPATLRGVEVDVRGEISGEFIPASWAGPGEVPEFIVVSVREVETGILRDDLIAEAEASREVQDRALEIAALDELDRYEAGLERAADMARECRL